MSSDLEYVTHTNHCEGFSIDYPKKYDLKENTGLFVVGLHIREGVNINVSIQDLRGEPELENNFLDLSLHQVKEMGGVDVKSNEILIGDKYKGQSIQYTLPDPGSTLKQNFFVLSGFSYIITYTSKTPLFSKYVHIIDHMSTTLKLIPAKGIKHILLSMKSATIFKQPQQINFSYQFWYPNSWKTVSTGEPNHYQFKSEEDSLIYQVSVDPLPESQSTLAEYTKKMVLFLSGYTNENINTRPLKVNGVDAEQVYFTSQSMQIKGSYHMVWFIYRGQSITLTFITQSDEMVYFDNIFNRLIAHFRLLDNYPFQTGKYNRFENLISKYFFNLPTTLKKNRQNTQECLVFEEVTDQPFLCVNLEDLPQRLDADQYNQILIEYHKAQGLFDTSAQGVPTRIDKYQARQTILTGIDQVTGTGMRIKVFFKSAVIRGTTGVLISLRAPHSEFESIYNRCFYIFDSLTFY
eukprot:gene9169-11237_t